MTDITRRQAGGGVAALGLATLARRAAAQGGTVKIGSLHPLTGPLALDGKHWVAVLYCAINTIGAYGAFAEALAHWEASRVSAILALTPLLTVATVSAFAAFVPGLIAPERIGAIGWIGALAVVGGSAAVSLLGARR